MKIQRGQASTEYLVIVGFVLIILIPVIIIYFKYSGGTSDIIESTKTTQLANELVKAANEVFSFGEGSQKKITISFPSGLTGLTFNGKEIVFTFVDSKGNANEFVEVADVNFAPTQVSITPGQKEVIIKALDKINDKYGEFTLKRAILLGTPIIRRTPNPFLTDRRFKV